MISSESGRKRETPRSPQCNIPNNVSDFALWSDDGIINLLCTVICTDLSPRNKYAPEWACQMLDDYVGVSGCSNELVNIWTRR
jgi:hypothetical protein